MKRTPMLDEAEAELFLVDNVGCDRYYVVF